MRGLKRGLIVGLILAVIVFLLPDGVLGALTVGTGLAAAVPAAAPPLGMTARALLAVAALFAGFALTFWLIRRRRNEWDDVDDDFDPAPLSAAEQMDSGEPITAAPSETPVAAAPAATRTAVTATATSEIDERLGRIESALAALPARLEATSGGDVVARVEALEARIAERLAAIDARLAMQVQGGGGLRRPVGAGKAIADIRRTLDGGA